MEFIITLAQTFIPLLVIYLIIHFTQQRRLTKKQLAYINAYRFPNKINISIKEKYPHLSDKEIHSVIAGLRDYFYIANQAKKKSISMPSQVVDLAWHEFILFTHYYEVFCKKSFGNFYHHIPAEAMQSKTTAQDGIKLAWKLSCKKEDINPKDPIQLPRLFALDSLLKIENGFKYSLNCKDKLNNNNDSTGGYCASDIGCSGGSSCGGDSGCSSSSCSGGCGGGD